MYTTLNKIRQHSPCTAGWQKLLSSLGKTGPDDEPLHLLTILESNGIEDALWALRAVEGYDSQIRLFAVKCARKVQHLMADPRSVRALDVAEAYAKGGSSVEELAAAWDAARAATWDAARAAEAAAWAAAWAAARAAARAAAQAAEAAARAAEAAAWDAAQAAEAAAGVAEAAEAAEAAAWAEQEVFFKEMMK